MLHPLLIATPIKFGLKFGYEVIFHCSSGCLVIRIHFVKGHDIEFMPARHTCVQVTAHAQPNIFSCVVRWHTPERQPPRCTCFASPASSCKQCAVPALVIDCVYNYL